MVSTSLSLDPRVPLSRGDLSAGQRWALAALAALAHVLAAVWIWKASDLPKPPDEVAPMMVSLISEEARMAPSPPPEKPPEPRPVVRPAQPKLQPVAPRVLASTRKAEAQEPQVPVAAPPVAKPAPADVAPPAAPPTPSAAPAVASAPEPSGPPPTLNLPSSALKALELPKPIYPPASRELGESGSVTFMLLIDETGHVKEARLTKSSGFPRLDRAALVSYNTMRLQPYIVNGVPRKTLAPHTITFNIDER